MKYSLEGIKKNIEEILQKAKKKKQIKTRGKEEKE